jgi:hypothetical protein
MGGPRTTPRTTPGQESTTTMSEHHAPGGRGTSSFPFVVAIIGLIACRALGLGLAASIVLVTVVAVVAALAHVRVLVARSRRDVDGDRRSP